MGSVVRAGLTSPGKLVLQGRRENSEDFEIDSRRVVIPSTGVPVIRHRARLDEWSVRFQIEIDNEVFTPDIVRLLVDDAGKKIGVGDFRPQRKGRYGKFVVTEWAEG